MNTPSTKNLILIGKPNVGKSTLFNQLTNCQEATGNRSGVTVEEKKSSLNSAINTTIVDFPGIDFFDNKVDAHPIDQQITLKKLNNLKKEDIIINVINAEKLASQLYLTLQLIELSHKIVVVLSKGTPSQKKSLTQKLGCLVLLPEDLSQPKTLQKILNNTKKSSITNIVRDFHKGTPDEHNAEELVAQKRYQFIQKMQLSRPERSYNLTHALDTIAMNRYLGLPIFFFVMFLTFWTTIVIGSLVSPVLETLVALITHSLFYPLKDTFLEIPLASLSFAFVTISSFIAPLTLLYFMLGLLEDTGYMQRAACVIDRAMQKMNLPGQSFIPILVGFGCNVPAIMSSRTINFEHDRIQTILMSPFMSCSARLAIFTVFASSFFGSHGGGHSIIFLLYILGFFIAILTGFVVRYVLNSKQSSCLIQEVSPYQAPNLQAICHSSFKKIFRFITKAGQVIIPFTLFIHLCLIYFPQDLTWQINPITQLFIPMGLGVEQTPAILSLFAGLLAKEVVIGALEAFHFHSSLLTISPEVCLAEFIQALSEAQQGFLSLTLYTPLVLDVDLQAQGYLQEIFPSKHSAISYMIFVLLYFPCLSVTATIAKESHRIWALFSSLWSTIIAYICATLYYQFFSPHFTTSSYIGYVALSAIAITLMILWLKSQVGKMNSNQIPMKIKAV